MEGDHDEASKVARFFLQIGLPVHLQQIGLSPADTEDLHSVVQGAMAFPFLGNLTATSTDKALMQALLELDEKGRLWAEEYGDEAYRALHS
ncbi:MAG: hypothetical protein ABJK20_13995 [Halieaceae bacterium]